MGGFKVKLVAWFALLALLPLTVAFYGFDTLTRRSETRRVDAALESALRAAVAGYVARFDAADASAQQLAADPELQAALRTRDVARLLLLLGQVPDSSVESGALALGPRPPLAAYRTVTVLSGGRVLGRVTVSVPIDAQVLGEIGGGLEPGDQLVAMRARTIVAGVGIGSPLALRPGRASRVTVDGTAYRALATAPFADPRGVELVALTPQAALDATTWRAEERLGTALLASLLLFAAVTYLLGRSIVSSLRRVAEAANAIAHGRFGERVEVRGTDEFAQLGGAFNRMAAQLEQRLAELEEERARLREVTARFGEALAATHDPAQLVRIVVESAAEATGADGGVVLGPHGELARAGDPDAGAERIAFPLRAGESDFGSLVLSGDSFDADDIETGASLAAQAVVALENARLHRIVERQALVDSLTGLANRRSVEETLRAELARAARFGDQICVVLADLDDFKQVNDSFGHAAGDTVLRAFAQTLQETVRESDVAGRWGGEEFALVLTGTDAPGGARFAERARAAIAERVVVVEGAALSVSASFGVASYPECPELGELLAAADTALYAAKRQGKNRVVVSAESVRS